ncbi:odorant receptor 22b-like isoform X2 [Cylas formicarius]|nr:odorant receptor 22b-like isoform X2 [Cylas formicarius]XP_060531026.1 odorant receptor 22b-like isoform X2 [Cylas formicarius]
MLNFSKYCMISAGIWRLPLPTDNPIFNKIYIFYSAVVNIYFPLLVSSMCIQFVIVFIDENADKSSGKLFKHFSYLITLACVEVTTILCQSARVKDIVRYIMEEEERIIRSEDEEFLQHHYEQLHYAKKVNKYLFAVSFGVAVSMAFDNLHRRFQVEKFNRNHYERMVKPLPYELYYFELDREKYDKVLLAISYVTIVVTGFLVASTKMIFISCIIFVQSALTGLQIRFRKVAFSEDYLKRLAFEHQRIVAFADKLNEAMKFLILLEYLLNSMNIAAVSIQFISMDLEFTPIFYFCYLCVQTFTLGWMANEIKIQSLTLADALYATQWYDQRIEVRKLLLTMITRAQKPLVLTNGPFDAMTTESTLRILKASYSYISLMLNNYQ